MVVARARRAPPAGRRVVRGRGRVGEGLSVVSCGEAARKVLEGEEEEEDGGMILLCRILVGRRLVRWWWWWVEGTVGWEGGEEVGMRN